MYTVYHIHDRNINKIIKSSPNLCQPKITFNYSHYTDLVQNSMPPLNKVIVQIKMICGNLKCMYFILKKNIFNWISECVHC